MKFLLWAAIVIGVIWVLRNKAKAARERTFAPAPRAAIKDETMLSCAHCGIHFPASEAVMDASGAVFCDAEHRRLHASR